jgi:hypothetical protein
MVKFCAQGYSITAFAGEIGASRDCITKWGQAYPDFLLAIRAAKAAAARCHEDHGRNIAAGGGAPGQSEMITFYLRNFAPEDFGEDREVDVKVDARLVVPRITSDMTPQQAADLYMATLKGAFVEPAAEKME